MGCFYQCSKWKKMPEPYTDYYFSYETIIVLMITAPYKYKYCFCDQFLIDIFFY